MNAQTKALIGAVVAYLENRDRIATDDRYPAQMRDWAGAQEPTHRIRAALRDLGETIEQMAAEVRAAAPEGPVTEERESALARVREDKLDRVRWLLREHECKCGCKCPGEHDGACERCLVCRISAAVQP